MPAVPLCAVSIRIFVRLRRPEITWMFMAVSSTTRMRAPGATKGVLLRRGAPSGAGRSKLPTRPAPQISWRSVNEKTEPAP